MISKLEVDWRHVAERRVTAFSVIEDFDVFEDFSASLGPCAPLGLVDQLALEGGEKTLGHCVVPAIGLATHAALDRVLREQLPILMAGVLTGFKRSSQHSV